MPTIKDEKLREKQSNYWHPIKGAGERWKSSWENGTNPIKGALDVGLAALLPSWLKVGQAIYDIKKSYDNLTSENGVKKTVKEIKEGDYGPAAVSFIGDLFDAANIYSPIAGKENIIKDRFIGVKDYLKWKKNPISLYYNSPSYIDKNNSTPIINISNIEGRRDWRNNKIEGTLKDTQTKVYARRTKNKEGKEKFSTFASIEKDNPNTLNIHLTNPGSTFPAISLATKSPSGTYIGDATFRVNETRNTNYPIGQQLINADLEGKPLNFAKILFGNAQKDMPVNYSTDSYPIILESKNRFPNSELRYLENVYTPLNKLGNNTFINGLDLEGKSLEEQLKLINDFILSKNPKARKAIIRDGEILFPHPMIYKK